ncbi:MAG: hypothetical protein QM758_21400 [Armatimonas sp.]
MNSKISTRIVWLLISLGVFLRIVVLIAIDPALKGDAASYDETARMFLGELPLVPDWSPGVSLYLALLYKLLGSSVWVSRLSMLPFYIGVSLTLPALVANVIGQLSRFHEKLTVYREERFVNQAAYIAVGVFAVLPASIWCSITPLTQMPTLLLFNLLALLLLLRPGTETPIRASLIGLCLGLMVLIRPSSIPLLAFALFVLLFDRVGSKLTLKPLRLVLPNIVACLLVFGVLVVGYNSWLYKQTGRRIWVNQTNMQNLYYGNNPYTPLYKTWWFGSHKTADDGVPTGFLELSERIHSLPIDQRDGAFKEEVLKEVKSRPQIFVFRTLNRVRTYMAYDTFAGAQLSDMKHPKAPGAVFKGIKALVLLGDFALYNAVCLLVIALFAVRGLLKNQFLLDFKNANLVVLGVLYSLPYFVSFSHSTYHFPLFGGLIAFAVVSAVVLKRELKADPADRFLLPELQNRKGLLLLGIAVFLLVQAEWTLVMLKRLPASY